MSFFSVDKPRINSHSYLFQGCNIPDIDIVVQWKLPSSVSSFVQRAGRAARGHGRTGLAVLLVEKSAYEADLSKLSDETAINTTKSKSKGIRQSSMYPRDTKEYAVRHGMLRGSYGGQADQNHLNADVYLDHNALDEGLYSLVQTGKCRRTVLQRIYGNDKPCKLRSMRYEPKLTN